MIMLATKSQATKKHQSGAGGFTMVEVVIAGAILVGTMTAIAQMGASALAGSKNISHRTKIESAVNNDIQLLQKADSYLTYEVLKESNEQENACANPTSYLISHLTQTVDSDNLAARDITRVMTVGTTTEVVEISYQFNGPETGIKSEYRVIELNPNFSAQCYTIQ